MIPRDDHREPQADPPDRGLVIAVLATVPFWLGFGWLIGVFS